MFERNCKADLKKWAAKPDRKPFSIDEATTQTGKKFKLINLPFYYVCVLEELLNEIK